MNETPIRTVSYNGRTIHIYQDVDAESPREWDNLGTIYSNHRSYSPDGKGIDELIESVTDGCQNVIPFDKLSKKYIYLKVWALIHSGITVKTGDSNPFSCPWDSGLFGIIAVDKARVRKEYGVKRITKAVRERVERVLAGEIEDLDKFYQGEIVMFTIKDEDGCTIDSCGGYYDIDEAIEEAKSWVDAA